MKNIKKQILIGFGTLLGSAMLGFLALVIICALPSGRAAVHVQESGAIMISEGDYWMILPTDDTMRLDNFTDCIMMLTSAYTGKHNALEEAAYSYRIYKKGASKQESCRLCGAVPKDQAKEHVYTQYWHGYKVFLKPLLTFFNISQIRTLNMYLIVLCVSVIVLLMYQNQISAFIFPYLAGICFLNLPAVAQSLQYSTVFHLTSFALIMLLGFWKSTGFRKYLWLYFLLVGISTSYMDFLTYPIITMTFPLIVLFALNSKNGISLRKAAIQLIGFPALWGIGYGGMWGSKWLIATLVTGKNQFSYALKKVLERSGNTVGGQKITYGDIMTIMYDYLRKNALMYILVFMILITVLLVLISRGFMQKTKWIFAASFMILACYPFIWYAFLKNHSYQHHFFTYRSMASFVFAAGSFLLPLINWNKFKYNSRR